jgi:hypothetical protein
MTDTTEEPNFEILDEKTVQTMDYILRGLELGKFDEAAKKVEFLGKLSGDKSPKYIATLIKRITELEFALEEEKSNAISDHSRILQLETDKVESDTKISTLENDMQDVAMAIRQLFEPKPLKNNWEMGSIEQFCQRRGAFGN